MRTKKKRKARKKTRKVMINKAGTRHLGRLWALNVGEMKASGRSKWDPYLYRNAFRFALKDIRGRDTYVATDGRKIVGTVTLTEPMTAEHSGGRGAVKARHLSSVWTHPNYRGQRISSRLIDKTVQEHGHEVMMSGTENKRLQASLPKRGFQRLGDITGGSHPEMLVSKGVPLFIRKPKIKR